jgi:hypothetical protein
MTNSTPTTRRHRRSAPISPAEQLKFSTHVETAVVGVLPAEPGTRVRRLRDGEVLGEYAVVGFAVLRSFDGVERAELWVRPITACGVISGRYQMLEPVQEPAEPLDAEQFFGAVRDAIAQRNGKCHEE